MGTDERTVAQFLDRWLTDVVRVKNAPISAFGYGEALLGLDLVSFTDPSGDL